jgi:NTP pyrophosphatase (non-canonical NTP hydrolase)
MIDLKKIQKEIYDNKKAKGFNTKDINFEFALAYGELAEAFDAYRKKQNNLGEELADVAIYLLGLAALLNIDLEKEIITKVKINQKRKYKKIKGVNIRVKD